MAILTGVRWNLTVVLICIPLMICTYPSITSAWQCLQHSRCSINICPRSELFKSKVILSTCTNEDSTGGWRVRRQYVESVTQKHKVSRLIGVPSGFILEAYPKQLGPEDLKFHPNGKKWLFLEGAKFTCFAQSFKNHYLKYLLSECLCSGANPRNFFFFSISPILQDLP